MMSKVILVCSIILITALIFTIAPKPKIRVDNSHPIVFFGNSITAGEGAGEGEDFPSLIGKKLNLPIINAGVSGNTTQDAIQRLNKDVISKNPSIVIVELGGNDILDRIDPKVTSGNIDLILSKIKPTGAKVVILGIKFFLFNQKYQTDLQGLASKYKTTFVPNILEGVITEQSLKFDDIHPNAKGYQKIAEELTPIIAQLTLQEPVK